MEDSVSLDKFNKLSKSHFWSASFKTLLLTDLLPALFSAYRRVIAFCNSLNFERFIGDNYILKLLFFIRILNFNYSVF